MLQRLPREVLLTAEGERLRCVVSDAFRCMDTVIGEIRQERISAPMEMICAPSFAMRWLMPRMGDFFLRPNLLLHDDSAWSGAPALIEWRTWLEHAGVDLPDLHLGQRFNVSQLAVGSAMTGQGIAMGRNCTC
ncbi:hypothetical protein [Achromobacter sp.]|uniref:hypothetical protein n=1 Tax=Achromobacter sp. TaxID=134375 RepID=UPI0028A9E499|nr:hypothetical protein [Achromobacter sp.]